MICDVTGSKNTCEIRVGAVSLYEVAIFVHVELVLKWSSIGHMADSNKNTFNLEFA